ncbi:MAG: hypothetical protein VX984_00190 [Thermodesulfobacteriota bacterium]|nr:hypothetical protein [Thermodesulfobacteriota bacterium]
MIQLSDLITNDIKFQAAREIIGKLKENKHEAFIVGGAVRDLLLKKNPDEFDICTSATPEEIQTIFNRTKAVGQSFGVILVLIDNVSIEVATFRKDMVYTDGRHPDKVIYTCYTRLFLPFGTTGFKKSFSSLLEFGLVQEEVQCFAVCCKNAPLF